MLLLCYIGKASLKLVCKVYADSLYTLANDAKVDRAVLESQLVGSFIDGMYHDFLSLKIMRENPKPFQAAVQAALVEQNVQKKISIKVK